MQQSNISSFKQFSNFTSLKSFNNSIEQWMIDHKSTFTPSERIALRRLVRFCSKVYGVCNARINTILEAIKDKDCPVGVSRSTFKRMLTKARRIGLIAVQETVRMNNSQSSNLYIFQPYQSNEPPRTECEQSEDAMVKEKVDPQLNHRITTKLFKANKINNNIRTYNADSHQDIIPDWLYNKNPQLVSLASNYFNLSGIKELVVAYMSVSNKSKLTSGELISLSVDALKQTIYRIKSRKKINNVYAYYTGTLWRKEKGYRLRQLWYGLF